MLKPEDCRPGVEVIAIKDILHNPRKPKLSVGNIYTIKKFSSKMKLGGVFRDVACVCLNEIPVDFIFGNSWGYYLECFKLRDPEELRKLFNVDNIKISENA